MKFSQTLLSTKRFILLVLLAIFTLPCTHFFGKSMTYDQCLILNISLLDIDGTQLVNETKDFLAEIYHVSPSIISTYYSGQHTDGRFIYPYAFTGDSGYVLWTVVGNQIIGDDCESF